MQKRTKKLLSFSLTFMMGACNAAEPAGYWPGPMRGPTPASISGGLVIDTHGLASLLQHRKTLLIDASPEPERPPGLAPGAVWMPLAHDDIPGSIWIAQAGRPALTVAFNDALRAQLAALTGKDLNQAIIVYCHPQCWLSWNAAKRIISYGYHNVYWYRDGIEGWVQSGRSLARAEAERILVNRPGP